MVAAPLLDAPDLVGAPEGVAVAVLAEPATLAGGLAGLAAIGAGTIALALGGAPVGKEEDVAAAALASARRTAHRGADAGNSGEGRKPKKRGAKKTEREEGRRASG
jgi:hypothetical protein